MGRLGETSNVRALQNNRLIGEFATKCDNNCSMLWTTSGVVDWTILKKLPLVVNEIKHNTLHNVDQNQSDSWLKTPEPLRTLVSFLRFIWWCKSSITRWPTPLGYQQPFSYKKPLWFLLTLGSQFFTLPPIVVILWRTVGHVKNRIKAKCFKRISNTVDSLIGVETTLYSPRMKAFLVS